ncbi:MAG: GNAT family N-acetyltransferase [Planctomycetes bacterium]|nr:GNAT family N-acetyltransferase [Planctomycetota bacterium]
MAEIIRPMTETDLPQVEEIDGTAFTELLTRLRNQPINLPSHEKEYFRSWMECDPEGSLVLEGGGEILGFNFCHARGRMGWVGPIAVRLDAQGKGIGKKLMVAGLDYFDRVGTKTVGLDTFPENPVSVSLYLRTGFRVVGGLFLLTMGIPPKQDHAVRVAEIELDGVDRIAVLDEKASGFDRRRDYAMALSSGLGCACKVVGEEDNVVFGLIRRGAALIGNFHLTGDGDVEARVGALVEGTLDFFRAKGLTNVAVLCRGNDKRLLDALFGLGFRMNPTLITMHRGENAPPAPLTSPLAIEKG